MTKKLLSLVVILAVVCGVLLLAGCTSSTSNADIQKKANDQIAAAKASAEDAKAKGVDIPADEMKSLTTAEGELSSNPLQAVVDASMAKANFDNDIKDAFNVANQTYSTALGAAQTAIKTAVAGSDLTQANQSVANAQAKKAAAKTINDYYNPTDGPIYWANLAAQQAAAASNAKAVATGQAQGATQEQKLISGYVTQIIDQVNKYLTSKNYNPATFTVGITKVNADASVVTAVAVPQQQMPGQPAYLTFIFQFKNGAYVLVSGPQ
jgi:uncharacterized protein YceK